MIINKEPPIVTEEPNSFWRENAQKLVGESIPTTEEVAKQLIGVNSLLEGIYFHAITFSNVKSVLSGWIVAIYLAPFALWLLSIIFAVLTISPEMYTININSTRDSKQKFEEIVSNKYRMLKTSEVFLILSFIALFAAIAHYLIVVPIAK